MLNKSMNTKHLTCRKRTSRYQTYNPSMLILMTPMSLSVLLRMMNCILHKSHKQRMM